MRRVVPNQIYSVLHDWHGVPRRKRFRVDWVDNGCAHGTLMEYGLADRISTSVLSTGKRGTWLVQEADGTPIDHVAERQSRARRIDPRMREALRLHERKKYSRYRLAEYFGVTESTIGWWLKRAGDERTE